MSDIILQGILLGMKELGFELIKYDEPSKTAYFKNTQSIPEIQVKRSQEMFLEMYGLKIIVEGV